MIEKDAFDEIPRISCTGDDHTATANMIKLELTGKISTAPLSGFFERTVPVTFGVADDVFVFDKAEIAAVDVILTTN
jgi:hypothetical protein